jgi:hypothetical protein
MNLQSETEYLRAILEHLLLWAEQRGCVYVYFLARKGLRQLDTI